MSWLSQVLTSKALAVVSVLHVAQEGLCQQSPQTLGSWPRFCLLAESQPAADVLTCCLVTQLALAPCRQTLDSWSPPCTPSTAPGLLYAQRVQAPHGIRQPQWAGEGSRWGVWRGAVPIAGVSWK